MIEGFKRVIKNKAFTNAGWIIGCKLCKAVLTLITTMITARFLGVADYGLINYAAGLVAFMTPLMKLGIDAILVHEIVINPDKEGETLGTTIILNIISSVLCIIGVVAFVSIANHGDKETLLVCFFYSLLLLFQAIEMVYYWFQAKLMAKYSSIAMLISYILITIVQVALVCIKATVEWFALSYSVDFLFIAVILLILYKKMGSQGLSFSWTCAKRLLNIGRYYIVSSLMVTVYTQTGRILLTLLEGNHATGIYSAATVCAGMTSFIFVAIIDSMRPGIFSSLSKDRDVFEYKMSRLYSIIIYFSLLQCICITLFSPLIIKILYGAAYTEAINVLKIMAWYTIFSYLGTVRNIWMLAEDKQRYLWIINLLGAVLNIGLNLVLIPIIGVYGATITAVSTHFFANVVVGYILPPIRKNNYLMIRGLNPKYILDIFHR